MLSRAFSPVVGRLWPLGGSRLIALLGVVCIAGTAVAAPPVETRQIVVYGATSGGIVAAIQAKKLGKSVIVIEPSRHPGGLTSGGLGATDIGNKAAIGGLAREFYRRIARHYAKDAAWTRERREDFDRQRRKGAAPEPEMWTFEPHVAERVYREWMAEADVEVVYGERLDLGPGGVEKMAGRIVSIRMESGRRFAGSMFIDASYEGDVMARAGVSYHVGRESQATYDESLNGVRTAEATSHQFVRDVDPFVKPGDPASGLLPLVSPDPPGADGSGDHRVQAYNFRMCTTDVPENRRPWPSVRGISTSLSRGLTASPVSACARATSSPAIDAIRSAYRSRNSPMAAAGSRRSSAAARPAASSARSTSAHELTGQSDSRGDPAVGSNAR